MIVDCALYRGGFRQKADGDIRETLRAARQEADAFLWIGLHEPGPEEFDTVRKDLGLHPLAIDDAAYGHQRPKLEDYGDNIFVVLKTATYAKPAEVVIGEIMLFVGAGFVITVRHGAANPLAPVRRRMESDPDLLATGPTAVLYAVLDEVVGSYDVVNHDIEADIIALESRIFTRSGGDATEDVYTLKREILEFRTAQDPLLPVLQELVKGRIPLCVRHKERFRDVQDTLLRIDQQIDAHSEMVTSVLTAHLALQGRQQNEDMRKISAWAAILAVPTMIAGIYGMNFEHMPETGWVFGYPLAVLCMAAACTVLYRKFKKSGWL
ncbi:magnesium and cobalt transport protein CorA [Actinocorallia populi]|uniref:magnesium and cobalt transport protein CorA n=1 Tax=Actinocorallia populi TaxID=2079200 RepID=UPI000D088FE4|nr:magnesium and cobalt transport protein CorA [Actinocorallia populi]